MLSSELRRPRHPLGFYIIVGFELLSAGERRSQTFTKERHYGATQNIFGGPRESPSLLPSHLS